MNKSDSEKIAGLLEKLGYSPASKPIEANLVIINACSVRQSAIDRVFGQIENLNKIKKLNKKLKIILTGCLLEKDKKILKTKVDRILNIKELNQWPLYLKPESAKLNFDYFSMPPIYQSSFKAFIPIMTGCNNYCSYCVVPYTRGQEVSRKVKGVLNEANLLANNHYKELTLLGQNVNSFNPPDKENFSKQNPFRHNFARLLWEINQIKNLARIHFISAHPKDMTSEVIKALTLPKQINYLHLPIQSGSNKILKLMNRGYSSEDYLQLIHEIRKTKPEIALGTDIIVGFPNETEEDFQKTLDIYQKIKFDIAYIAIYSPRSQTLAAKIYPDNLSYSEKKKRWNKLHQLMEKITFEKNQKYKNKTVSILVEKSNKGYLWGNSSEMKLVKLKGPKKIIGQIVQAKIKESKTWVLKGELL